MPAASDVRAVDLLDDARPDATQAATRHRSSRVENAVSPYERVVGHTFASWNWILRVLRQLEGLRSAA
jgi:hypothetical protein